MAKDPATLWYWNDWHSGTILMSRHLKGCYMDLLHAQFNHGPLSLEEVKAVLGSDFGQTWPILVKKFSEKEEKFFNERMEQEKQKRKKHSEHQRQNAKKRWDKSDGICDGIANANANSMPLENENENRNEIVNNSFGKFENLLSEIEINSTIEFVSITANKILKTKEVENYWTAFGIHSEKKYSTRSDRLQHFRSWLKIQIQTKKDGLTTTQTGGKHKGAMQLVSSLKQDFAARRKEDD